MDEKFSSDSDTDEETKKQRIRNSSSETSYDEEEVPETKTVTIKELKPDETLVQSVQDKEDKMSVTVVAPQPRRKRFIPNYDVEGVAKIVISDETQLQIDMVVGTHVNVQYPWKEVSTAKILEMLDIGGPLCDFFPLSDILLKYTEKTILMGYIIDEGSEGDQFYICCTKEARDHCKQQSDKFIKRQEKKLQKSVLKTPKPWICLGSDKEIISLRPINTRNMIELEIKAKFPTTYDPVNFVVRDCNAVRDGYIELTPYRQKFNNVYRRRVDCEVQVTPAMVHQYAQTILKYPQNKWTQSIADALGKANIKDEEGGGGDAGLDLEKGDNDSSGDDDGKVEEEVDEVGLATFRAAHRRLRRPSYIKLMNNFMSSRVQEMDSIVELNTVMDIYCNDYPNLVYHKATDSYTTMTFEEYVCFTHVRAKDKYVSCAVFHPMWSGIVAICYSDGSPKVMKNSNVRPDPIQRAVYGLNPVMIWSHIDSLLPKLYLESPREVKTLAFCPFNENLLIGGLINGQIILWDITNKLESVEDIEVLSETREKYKIAMNAHMGWMKPVQDNSVVSATALSNLMTSHYGPVTDLKWLSPNFEITSTGKMKLMIEKHSLQFLSASEDGNILIWNLSVENVNIFETKKVKKSKRVLKRPSGLLVDVSPFKILDRNLQPSYKVILGVAGQPLTLCIQNITMTSPLVEYIHTSRDNGKGRKYFTCKIIRQDESDINTTFYCGSQHGEVVKASWDGHEFNTGEVVNSEYCNMKFKCCIHDGIVACVLKNPLMDSLTLTVGGKIFAVWSENLLNRPLTWKKRPYRLTDGAWSMYKPSLLFIATSEGTIEVWDLLLKSDKPISVQTLSGSMLTHVTVHTLPLTKNLIGVSDGNGSFRMYLNPPIFQLESPAYLGRMEAMVAREIKVLKSFIQWQDKYMKSNPDILLEMKRKEGALLIEKEEEKRRLREEQEKREEEEAEARRLAKLRVIGPEEKWQRIVQKLIERTIAVKKRINRAELIENEKPLRELEAQRLEKERRMLDIMKNQKAIFNDTVAILFPEAVKRPPKVKKSFLSDNKEALKKEYLEDYDYIRSHAFDMVHKNRFKVQFVWDETILEGKERRQALNSDEGYIMLHKERMCTDDSHEAQEEYRGHRSHAGGSFSAENI